MPLIMTLFFFFWWGALWVLKELQYLKYHHSVQKKEDALIHIAFCVPYRPILVPSHPFFFFLNSSSMLWQPHIVQYFSFGCETFVFPTRMKDVKLRDYIHLRIPHIAGLARGLKGVFLSVVSPSGFLTVLTWEMKMSPVPKSLCDHKS